MTHYSKMTPEHLGSDATERDLAEFTMVCEMVEELHPDLENVTNAVWGDGDYIGNAIKLGVDLQRLRFSMDAWDIANVE